MKKIPVTKNFDNSKVIGELKIDAKKLPKTPNYCFTIGGRILKVRRIKGKRKITKFELTEIALVNNEDYKKYLNTRSKNR